MLRKEYINLKVNIYGLEKNHDDYGVELLENNKLKEKEEIKNIKVNELNIEVNINDTIDYIRKRIVIELLNKLNKNKEVCQYCFKDSKKGEKNIIHKKDDKYELTLDEEEEDNFLLDEEEEKDIEEFATHDLSG